MSIAFLLVASRFLRVKGHSLTKNLGNSLEILGFFLDNPSFPFVQAFPGNCVLSFQAFQGNRWILVDKITLP